MPTGTFSQKTHCHEMPSITAPPTSGPLAIATPPTAPQMPSATPRRAAGNASERMRQRQRHHERAAEALYRAGGDERVHRRCERSSRRGDGEERDPQREHAAPAEAVAERCARQEEHREGQGVGVHRPLELLDRRAEVDPDHRERRRHDEVVEDDHEEADRGDRERPERPSPGSGLVEHRAAPFALVIQVLTHHLLWVEKSSYASSRQPSTRRRAHGSSELRRSIAATTFSSIPLAKNGAELRRADARHALGPREEVAVAFAHDRANLRVVARGVGLHLRPSAGSGRAAAPMYASPMASSASSPRFPSVARWNVSSVSRKPAADARDEELLLRAEEAEEVGLRDPGPLGDRLRRRAVVAGRGELASAASRIASRRSSARHPGGRSGAHDSR